ncbi:MAG: hypothetical protein K0S32_1340 [Bacteroidetes bacterium]|jgi:hypothetical protein|nr:hypothetical protein [Bacteroidota bacterium]
MNTSQNVAKHFREVFFGGNWTVSNLKGQLADVTWQEATTKVHSFNTIATLTFHINYFVDVTMKVLEGGELNAHDKFSFDHPPINSQADWEKLVNKALNDADRFADLVAKLPENKLWENFVLEKYGIYYRNIHGIIEHTHYHLGQIALIKKLVRLEANTQEPIDRKE